MLAKSCTVSGCFPATGGGEVNSDNWFISTKRTKRVDTVTELEKKNLIWEAKNVH